jgi:WD40 repeat protein
VAFSADGRRLVTGSLDQTAKVWDALTGVELLTLKDNQWIEAVAFSAVGQRILTGGGSRGASTLKIWEGATGEQIVAWQAEEKNAEAQQAALTSQQAAADQLAMSLTAQDQGAISQWLVLGPLQFEDFNGAKILAEQQISDEALLRPTNGAISQVAGKDWAWRAYSTDDYRLLNRRVFRMFGPTLAYAVSYIQSDTDRNNLLMKVGSQGESKIYLNQKEIYRHDKPRKFVADQDTAIGVALKRGTNVLVFKVVSEDTVWRASLRLSDAGGQPLKGIRVTLTPP